MHETETAIEALIRMANQIADNYGSMPPGQATQVVANHLRMFWAPSMRADLLAFVDDGGQGLDDVPRAAVELLRHS